MSKKIVVELTPEKMKELQKDLNFIGAFIGIMETLAKNVDNMGDDIAGCDIWTLAEESQERVGHLKDHLLKFREVA